MAKLHFEDVEVGAEIPSYTRKCTIMKLISFACANDEIVQCHIYRDDTK